MCSRKSIILFVLLFFHISLFAQKDEQLPQSFFPKGSLSFRSNAVPWLLLIPNVGFEYKVSDAVGVIVDGAYSKWNLDTSNKYWNVWNVAPQVRYYTGKFKDSYIGGQYMMGEYNLTGTQGNYLGGGLSLGHQFDCGHNLMVDLGLSLGYLYLFDTEEYSRKKEVNIRTRDKYSHGYWGPTGVSITFVWKIN